MRRDAALVQDGAGLAGLLQREREQQPLCCDEAVAGLVRGLFRRVESTRQLGREIDLARAAARNFRPLADRVFGCFEDCAAKRAIDRSDRIRLKHGACVSAVLS